MSLYIILIQGSLTIDLVLIKQNPKVWRLRMQAFGFRLRVLDLGIRVPDLGSLCSS